MGSPITVRVNDTAFKAKIQDLMTRTKHKQAFFRTWVIPIMYKDIMQHFSDESSPEGHWTPLSEGTLRERMKKSKTNNILQDTGLLRLSVITATEKDSAMKTTDDYALIGSNKDYAATHQFGRGAIPARPYLWLSSEALDRILKNLANWIIGEKNV